MATSRTFGGLNGDVKINVGRADYDFVASVTGNQGKEVMKESPGLLGILVHLPVGGHHFFARHGILSDLLVFADSWIFVAPASRRLSRGRLAPARRARCPPDSRQDAGATQPLSLFLVRERFYAGQLFAFQKLQRSSAAGGDVCNLVGNSRRVHG